MIDSDIDLIVKMLYDKKCPLHRRPMKEIRPLILHEDYRRDRYICPDPTCECRVEFVDGEIKTDSICRTLVHLNVLEYPDNIGNPIDFESVK